MSEFKCRMGGVNPGVDPREKYQVESSQIHTFHKESTGTLWFKKWALTSTFNVSNDTQVVRSKADASGNGIIVLQNGNERKAEFFIHQETDKFVGELKRAGLNIR